MQHKDNLHRGYQVISNKTVRRNEKFIEIWYTKNTGVLKRTNRGYFLDGKCVSWVSAENWLESADIINYRKFVHGKRVEVEAA